MNMSGGWDDSAQAWIASMGDQGDFSRQHILDPAMLERIGGRWFAQALDIGCGEGRFCRLLKSRNIAAIGIDPTRALIEEARRRDPEGDYRLASAEKLPFADDQFDLAVSYLTLIDIPDFRAAIREMTRVLKPGGTLLIANINAFISSAADQGWVTDGDGRRLHYPVDRYLDEFPTWVEWGGIKIENWHRPFSAYMTALLENGLELTFFDEPRPRSGDPERQAYNVRAPWFHVMEWRRPK
ncbi:MAG: class I SAM-dependent methyltransferase [Pseudomonadota bacterium]